MSNISNLFENLMTYNETNKKVDKPVVESDSTLLNLTVEIPNEVEEITPEDVKVDVGVMNVDTTDTETVDTSEDMEAETEEEVSKDVTPEDEAETSTTEDEETPNKEEALNSRKEIIRKKRLEAKQLREAKKDSEKEKCTGKDDCTCEACKTKNEGLAKIDECQTPNDVTENETNEAVDVETAKVNIRKRVASSVEECKQESIKKESLMHLDTKSLNRLFTEFVKENYKNIDKVVITKAMLENKTLKLEGTIINNQGESEKISIVNRGFDASKLEGKRFVMDFRDASNTFGVIKESLKKPFVFTCTLLEGVLTFEELKYSYKTMHESNVAEIFGKCVLTESLETQTENADQVKKFHEIVDKIKAAKTANDLLACKDEMDDSNIGDTLLAAAQMVWDDVNARMKIQ